MIQIDQAAIENLKALQAATGKDLLGQLIEMYSQSTPAVIEEMKGFLETKSYQDLSRTAHSLKSSSANLGLVEVAEVCKSIEYKTIGNEGFTHEELVELVGSLQRGVPQAIEALKKTK